MGNVLGPQPFPIGGPTTSGKAVGEMGGLSDEEKMERRKNAENCVCPFLKTAYVQGFLEADENGYATLQDCYALMDWCGAGRAAFPTPGYFKKFGLTGVPILHLSLNRPNDTGIMHAYIGDEERRRRFEEFVSFANEKGEMGTAEMNKAVNHFAVKNKASKKWLFAPEGELITIIAAFGHKKHKFGPREYLTIEDIENLWVKCEYPEGWFERRTPETKAFSTIDLMMGVRLLHMQTINNISSLFGNKVQTTDPMPRGFAPRPDPPYSDAPGEPPMTEEQIQKIPNSDKLKIGNGICLWDSRSGAIQDLAEVNNGEEWDLNDEKNKIWWQTTVEEAMKDLKEN